MCCGTKRVIALWAAMVLLWGAAPAVADLENRIIAIVNEDVITLMDLEAALFDQADSDLAQLPPLDRRRAALEQLIEERLILQAAKQAKMSVDEQLVEERLAALRQRFESDTAFAQALMADGLTRAMLRKRYRDQLMMQRAIEQEVRVKIVVTPNAIARYYREHPQEMQRSPRVRARHIMMRITSARPDAEALATIESLRRQLLRGGSFADVAHAASEGEEAAQGGDLGWITPGQLRPELDDVLFHLEPGVVSEPIQSDMGYHLVQVEEREPVAQWSFEQVELSIREKLLRLKFEQKLAQWLADLRAKAYIVIKTPTHAISRAM